MAKVSWLDSWQAPAERSAGSYGQSAHITNPGRLHLRLLGRFALRERGRTVSLGTAAQRLLAYLALADGPVLRREAAGVLWPDLATARANANLRSAVWRLQRCCPLATDATYHELSLAAGVAVDVDDAMTTARRLLDRSTALDCAELSRAMQVNLYEDLLPDWLEDEWLIAERERFRQLRLHALEALCERQIDAAWFGAAVDTILAAVSADPLRESAQHLLIKTYLVEGNQCEALQQYRSFRRLLRDELGLEPSDELERMLFAGRHRARDGGATDGRRRSP